MANPHEKVKIFPSAQEDAKAAKIRVETPRPRPPLTVWHILMMNSSYWMNCVR
jgi:hypothetical protein